MKQFISFVCLALVSTMGYGQILVGQVDINKTDSIRIVEVYINRQALKNIVHVYVDFGQRDNLAAGNLGIRSDDLLILEPDTKRRKVFTSTAAVLNFFERNGWDYLNGFAENEPDTPGYYYHFRKRVAK